MNKNPLKKRAFVNGDIKQLGHRCIVKSRKVITPEKPVLIGVSRISFTEIIRKKQEIVQQNHELLTDRLELHATRDYR